MAEEWHQIYMHYTLHSSVSMVAPSLRHCTHGTADKRICSGGYLKCRERVSIGLRSQTSGSDVFVAVATALDLV